MKNSPKVKTVESYARLSSLSTHRGFTVDPNSGQVVSENTTEPWKEQCEVAKFGNSGINTLATGLTSFEIARATASTY